MVEVEVTFSNTVQVKASPEEAYELLADVKRSGLHFPDVESLEPSPRHTGGWRWKMKEKGLGPISLKIQYDAIYEADGDAKIVSWRPPSGGGGDMDSYGSWTIRPSQGGGTELTFDARTVAHVRASRLVAKMVEVVAREELSKLKRRYVDAIKETLDA
ncbi:MAG: SRPBCC family protein [Deltaproteobacteria bacterium]|nr:SRPBCC family protein [Deltaproteobacteria bacterium]